MPIPFFLTLVIGLILTTSLTIKMQSLRTLAVGLVLSVTAALYVVFQTAPQPVPHDWRLALMGAVYGILLILATRLFLGEGAARRTR